MSCEAIAKVRLLDDDTIRTWYRLYEEDGIEGLTSFSYEGSACHLRGRLETPNGGLKSRNCPGTRKGQAQRRLAIKLGWVFQQRLEQIPVLFSGG